MTHHPNFQEVVKTARERVVVIKGETRRLKDFPPDVQLRFFVVSRIQERQLCKQYENAVRRINSNFEINRVNNEMEATEEKARAMGTITRDLEENRNRAQLWLNSEYLAGTYTQITLQYTNTHVYHLNTFYIIHALHRKHSITTTHAPYNTNAHTSLKSHSCTY